jgi:putative Ca2+/H+ antiporter (TMEM165/GDT1 family)
MAVGAAVGMAARVAAAEHDPADIAAGAALGLASARAVAALAGDQRGRGGA